MTPDMIRLVQWLSPAFPVGGFAYSQGLEAAIAEGRLCDAAGLEAWIGAVLAQGSARNDAILLALVRAGDDLEHLADLARALAPSAARWQESAEQGRAFGGTMTAIIGRAPPDLPYPLAVGLASRALALSTEDVLALWLQAAAAQLVSVAVRVMPLGQNAAQARLARLVPDIAALARSHSSATPDDLITAAFAADLAAMRQETLEVRLFRS